MKRVVVGMDSRKGCLDSLSASKAVATGVAKQFHDAKVICVPVADGGEGTAEAMAYGNDRFIKQTSLVTGPMGEKVSAKWYLDEETGTAVIDMAAAAGLNLVEESRRDPLKATTYGVGELILEAVSKGAKKILLGLAGSATVDGGMGAIQALTKRQTDSVIESLKRGEIELDLLCDVEAPFTGERGAARVFGPQKGASAEDVEVLEERLEDIRRMALESQGIDLNKVLGSGAAGGLAGGLMALAGGRIVKGAETILDAIGFDDIIEGADLIITGEGSSDRQTLMGKIPFEILQRGKRKGVPVWLMAGRVSDEETLLQAGFERVICINSPENIERSGTPGMEAMEPEVAKTRLSSILN